MARTFEGKLIGKGRKFGIAVSRFNSFVTHRLLSGATDALVRHDVAEDDIDVAWVPGSFELPQVAARMAASGKYDAVIALGALIRGATPHFEYIAAEATRGLGHIGLQQGPAVTFGVITADTLEQAIERAGSKSGNKGAEAALAALEMVNLLAALEGKK